MNRSRFPLSLGVGALAAFAVYACGGDDDDDANDPTDTGASSSSSSSGESGSSGAPSEAGASSSSSGTAPTNLAPDFATTHDYVGCYEIGALGDGRIQIAGRSAAVLTAAGAVDPSFDASGFDLETPGGHFSSLDGAGAGFFHVAAQSFGMVRHWGLDGVASFDAISTPFDTVEAPPLRADASGTLFFRFRSAGGGGTSNGIGTINSTGVQNAFLGAGAGGDGPFIRGPFSTPWSVEHYADAHYAFGVVQDGMKRAIVQVDLDGALVDGFTPIELPDSALEADGASFVSRLQYRVSPTRIYTLLDGTTVRAFARATGEAIALGTEGHLTLDPPSLTLAVDEQDHLYATRGATEVVRFALDGAVDQTFSPESLTEAPSGVAKPEIALGVAPGKLLVTQCFTDGANLLQTTSQFSR